MCCAIAEAVGVYETIKPVISDTKISLLNSNTFLVEVNASDNIGIYSVSLNLYQKINEDQFTNFPNYIFELDRIDSLNFYSKEIQMPKGEYKVEITVEDLFFNTKTVDESNLSVGRNAGFSTSYLISLFLFSFLIISRVIKFRNK